jgi:outer membrane protein assembly factor BamB
MNSVKQWCGILAVLLAIAGPVIVAVFVKPKTHDQLHSPRADETKPNTTELNERFFAAARKGDAALMRDLLDEGVDVNAKTEYGATALSFAADKGHLAAVKVLLNHKAEPNVKDSFYKATPLVWAVQRGHVAIVRALLDAGAEGADESLRNAIGMDKIDLVRAILDTGKVKDDALTNALAATPANSTEIADALKKAGAKPAAKTQGAKAAEVVDRDTLASYVGSYRNDDGQELTIGLADGKPTLEFFSQKMDIQFTDKTSFQLTISSEIQFKMKHDAGKVTAVSMKRADKETLYNRNEPKKVAPPKPIVDDKPIKVETPSNWPSFRGLGATGVADGQFPPAVWDADKGTNIRWKTPIPGLGHSCPIVWNERVFVTTAVSGDPKADFKPGLYGDADSVDDKSEHAWKVCCLDKKAGTILWERTAHTGVPSVKRHMKGSHANPTPATDGKHIVACFGSEGLYCFDLDGKPLWKQSLGVLDSGWFYDPGYQWGFGSSPILYKNKVIVQCDVGKNSFIAAYDVADGKRLWQTPREEIPSWGTPTVIEANGRAELVTNATKFARGYDPETGKELWRLARHSEITVPTPFLGQGLIFITSGYRPVQPIYAIKPGATGDISLKEDTTTNDFIAWSVEKGGTYQPTPIVYGDHLYTCSNDGIVTCYEAKTGKRLYRERLSGAGGHTASPVAADGRIYFTSEEKGIRVIKAGPTFELLAVNQLGDPCMATPAISDGMIFIRSQHVVFGIGRKERVDTSTKQ